jgi:hypothetical protein
MFVAEADVDDTKSCGELAILLLLLGTWTRLGMMLLATQSGGDFGDGFLKYGT